MIKSFISLKPMSPLGNFKRYSKLNHIKKINFILQAIEELSQILDFLQLQEIYKLYFIFIKNKHAKQVQNKITHYLTVSQRKFSPYQEKNYVKYLTEKYSKFALKQYTIQNTFWKQLIHVDIQRTTISQISSSKTSQSDLLKNNSGLIKKNPDLLKNNADLLKNNADIKPKQSGTYGRQIKLIGKQSLKRENQTNLLMKRQINNQSRQKTDSILSNKNHIVSVKFNFLMLNYAEQTNRRKQTQRKATQNLKLKKYLKIVLNAISNRNKKLGYVQGLNFWIKHMFQLRLSEQDAFIYSCFLLQKMNAQMLFKQQMLKVRQMCYVFDIYLFNNLPDLYYLLKIHDVSSTVYASNWFITLFSEQLDKQKVRKLWHLFAIKGWKVFIQFGIGVMCVFQQQIKSAVNDQILSYMRNILLRIDDEVQQKICALMSSIKVSNRMINYLSQQMKFLYDDTEIQLWRLQQQKNKIQNERFQTSKYSSFSCRPSLSTIDCRNSNKKISYLSSYYDNECSTGCYNSQKQTEVSQDTEYSFMSLCKSVHYS